MEKMKSDVPLDYAVFQLSPKRARCELFVSSGGSTEKLVSGLLKPFIAHLKVAEEQVASAAQSVKLEVGQRKNAQVWFTKGTLERFVRFVSSPEVLELVNSSDAEMAQLEAARKIYSQGVGDQHFGGGGSGFTSADDATKMELLRAIDVRLMAVQQDLSTACARAAAAGFNADTVSELQMFGDRFGAHRLNEACSKFISMCERRPNLMNQWKPGLGDRALRSSCESDMSIDDDMPSPHPTQEPIVNQQLNPHHAAQCRTFSRETSVEQDDGSKQDDASGEKIDASNPEQTESIQASQPARRLSVQDRINMFENKQKESSVRKPVVAKAVELRRMSSDLSTGTTAEKSVLRRWSGASDMSFDLSAEKKDGESPLCTPSSAPVYWENKVMNLNDGTTKSYSVVKPEIKVIPSLSRDSDIRSKEGCTNSVQNSESGKFNSNLVSGESDVLKGEVLRETQSTADNQEKTEGKLKNLLVGKSEGGVVFGDEGKKIKGSQCGEEFGGSQSQVTVTKYKGSSLPQARLVESTCGGQVYFSNQREYPGSENEPVMQTSLKVKVKIKGDGMPEGSSGSRIHEAFTAHYKGVEADSSIGQQEVKSVGNSEVVEKKESHASEKVSSGSVLEVEGSGPRKMKSNRQGLGADLSKKVRVQRDESHFSGNSRAPSSGKVTADSLEGSDFSTPPPELYQRGRQSKGNQERNDELKMKANELEKLFAVHKMRVPGDQLNSTHKGKSEDKQYEPTSSLQYSKLVADFSPRVSHKSDEPTGSSKNKTKSNFSPQIKTTNSQNYADALSKNFSELSVTESSRGKLYDKYVQKRDAKLREDWSFNRAEKEARFKSMQDSLERNRSEMKAKLSGSVDRQDSVSSARRRAERLRSFTSRSIIKRVQPSLDFEDSEDDGEALELLEEYPREDRALDDISSADGIFRGSQGKKPFPNSRNLSSTPRNSAVPVTRSANRTSTNSGKRRIQQENPLAQSVPNFSDLRKENTKPSSGGSKTIRSQARNCARIKSANEDAAIFKEDKPHRLQTIRKSSTNPREFRDMPSLESDVDLTPVKFDEEVQKSVGTKSFLKKGSRASFVSQTSIPRQRVPVGSEPANKVDENDGVASGPDEPGSIVKDETEDEFKSLNSEDDKILDDADPIPAPDSDKFVNSGSENGDSTLNFSRVGQALGSQLPSEISSSFLPVDVQDWPGESPTSWNSRGRYPFSYPHEMSDVDAFADSPVGSPASWNSQSLNQMENDAARMRKKWGMAQKPMLVAHSSNNSRKDMTRGIKRLLKFGRKSRGSESLVDWISATTSEGDDDMEDGRDIANRSSEDLRKSRMGFCQAQPSGDSFNEHEVFSESVVQSAESSIPAPPANFKLREDHYSGSSIKAPRSFFSLSTFRSKGS